MTMMHFYLFALAIAASCTASLIPLYNQLSPRSPLYGQLSPRSPMNGFRFAAEGQAPFLVGIELRKEGRLICGSTLISPTAVLTLASCVEGQGPKYKNILVRAGSHRYQTEGKRLDGGITANILQVKLHPDGLAAVLILRQPIPVVKASSNSDGMEIGYARFAPAKYDPRPKDKVNMFGWSVRSPKGAAQPKTPIIAPLIVYPRTDCQKLIGNRYGLEIFCMTWAKTELVRLELRDAGGPLTNKKGELVGISKAIQPEPTPPTPPVYGGVRVGPLMMWIQTVVKDLPTTTTNNRPGWRGLLIPSSSKKQEQSQPEVEELPVTANQPRPSRLKSLIPWRSKNKGQGQGGNQG